MAAEGTPKESAHDPIESSIDDVIREILEEAGSSKAGHSRSSTSLLDMVTSAVPARGGTRAPMLERVLIAEALAGALSDALAPALAAALAPRIMKALEQEDDDGAAGEKTRTSRSRKSDAK